MEFWHAPEDALRSYLQLILLQNRDDIEHSKPDIAAYDGFKADVAFIEVSDDCHKPLKKDSSKGNLAKDLNFRVDFSEKGHCEFCSKHTLRRLWPDLQRKSGCEQTEKLYAEQTSAPVYKMSVHVTVYL